MSKKRVAFGEYVLAYVGTSNNMIKRGVPEIALNVSNDVVFFYFMSLYTGRRIHRYIWNEITTDDDFIRRVEELVTEEKQHILLDNHPLFKWRPGTSISNSEKINDDDTIDGQQVIQEINENGEINE